MCLMRFVILGSGPEISIAEDSNGLVTGKVCRGLLCLSMVPVFVQLGQLLMVLSTSIAILGP